MRAFRRQSARAASVRKSDSFLARPTGPAVRATLRRSSSYAALQAANSWSNSISDHNMDNLTLIGGDAVKQPAPFAAREANDEVAEIDILGIGQAAVDFAASVDDKVLAALNVPKGGRRVISVEERAQVMQLLEGYDSQVSAGGSLANTLVGLGQLSAAQDGVAAHQSSHTAAVSTSNAHNSSTNIKVAMTGCVVGNDALGEFAQAQLGAAGVEVVPTQPPSSSATGVVMVFTTPDAQRSFLSSFSSEDRIVLTEELKATVARARLVVIEGYMWEVQGSAEVIPEIIKHARSCGTLVALTAGDASVIQRHADKVLGAIETGVDLWFGNEAEAAALVQHIKQQKQQHQLEAANNMAIPTAVQLERMDSGDSNSSCESMSLNNQQQQDGIVSHGQECALQLASICPMVVVTDGSRGSYITALGQLIVVPPYWSASPPVDTCGAGDAYAAGLLYGFLHGLDLHSMGQVAAKTASAVISRHGPQLTPDDADWVAAGLEKQQQQSSLAAAAAATAPQQQVVTAAAPVAVVASSSSGLGVQGRLDSVLDSSSSASWLGQLNLNGEVC